MKQDIQHRADIVKLVDAFYAKVELNPIIGPVFNEVAKVDWDQHLPRMYAFWSGLLLGESGFTGNPMHKHVQLSKQTPMNEERFSEWLMLFNETVDVLFEGEKADEAKIRAANIARLMLYKIQTNAEH